MMRVAVVGSGVAGLTAARTLAQAGVQVVLYERNSHIGGHAHTIHVDGVDIDLGFLEINQVAHPHLMTLFKELGVDLEASDRSFAVSLDEGRGCEWGSISLAGLFAQRRNAVNPFFWNMIREIIRFHEDIPRFLQEGLEKNDASSKITLGEFLQSRGYSEKFRECYLIPVCASIWSCSSETMLGFSALAILTLCRNHHFLQLFGRPERSTLKVRSETFVNKIIAELKIAGAEIKTSTAVARIKTLEDGRVQLEDAKGSVDIFDKCVVGAHAPDALGMRGEDATDSEKAVLGAFQYTYSDIYVHRDKALMPRNTAAWSAWNFMVDIHGRGCVTNWLNLSQNASYTRRPLLVTVNPPKKPEGTESFWRKSHPVPTLEAATAFKRQWTIQGHRAVWYCGAYQGFGSHEDALESGFTVAKDLLGLKLKPLPSVKLKAPTWSEYLAQQAVIATVNKLIRTGTLRLLESGGSLYEFVGVENGCSLTCTLQIHSPAFYWKIATRADLGLADSYIDGDFSFFGDSKENNLFNFIQLMIANMAVARSEERTKQKRGLWSPVFVTSAVGSTLSYLRHAFRDNSLTNARRNISQHYDLSNDMFSMFLDETMTYSTGIFKGPDDKLKDAQFRKMHLLIDKARIDPTHEVLEIGFGWGSMAIETVRRTGCRFTGITLSEEMLKLAEKRVKEAGLENSITFLLCDYRDLPDHQKYDRIISCEMLEHVGAEYYKAFFAACDRLLAHDGLVVLQTITIPDERFEEYRRSSDFIKEYIFPGGCLPCLAALTAAMKDGSTLSVEHLESIGPHYVRTLMCWRENLLANSSEIRRLGFSEKFIRTWEYYFVYSAAGFQSRTLGDLQLVLSRPGNWSALGSPYISFPMAFKSHQEVE